MAVVIRLTKMGKKGERKYRVAVKEKRSKRDGGAIEYLGWYEKTETTHKKQIDRARFDYWLSKGAQASPTVTKIMEQA